MLPLSVSVSRVQLRSERQLSAPVSAAGLISLQNLILERNARTLDATSKQNMQRHLLKFAKVTQLSLTKSALQQNHIQLLMAVNNEAKPRRATKADILE
jgi:hypothetical protein